MMTTTQLLLAARGTSLLACGGHAAGPALGEEKGNCYPNRTCKQGLTCFSNMCVRYGGGTDASNTTGAAGTMGAAAAGAAGATGAGGLTDAGGSADASDSSGAGGSTSAGGSTDARGSSGA